MTSGAFVRRLLLALSLAAVLPGLVRQAQPTLLAAPEQAQELFQRGLTAEHSRGDLEAAVALFEQAARAAGADRELAARAWIRAAGVHEKLGQRAEAVNTYADVMRVYPEQRAQVAVAQTRLSALRRHDDKPGSKSAAPSVHDTSSTIAPVIVRYCGTCHNAGNRSGGLDLTMLTGRSIGENTGTWEKILGRLRARHDPPSAPRPDETTYRSLIVRLEQALDAAYAAGRTANGADRASDTDMAARIAALIWNSAPDAVLLDEAQRGRLRDPAALNRQVVRMLRDPRSSSLVDGFFTSWLSLDRVKSARPDPARYPQFDAELLQAMDTETRLFLESQLHEDRDASEIWTANYTFLNERLARHYGLSGIVGKEFRRITWPSPARAGILGQAGPLTALSFPSRTSPTVRGRFVLSRFLGVDAPGPPANVPPLAERPATPGTMRDRLQDHRLSPSCSSCHALFDPLGFALENFDATGAWRTMDGGVPIDASGALINGTRFDGPAELRAGLLKYRDAYYTSLTQELLTYALNRKGKAGRVYDYEMPAVRKIVRDASANQFRWSSILAGVCASAPFQMKQIVP